MRKILFLCLVATAAMAAPPEEGESRGFLTDMTSLFEGVSETIDELQAKAGEEIKRLKPVLVEAESRMGDAGEQIVSAIESLADAFSSSSSQTSVDRRDDVLEDAVVMTIHGHEAPSGLEPDFGGFFPQGLFPFNLFTKKWYEGANVCTEEKLFDEHSDAADGKEKSEETTDAASSQRKLFPFFAFTSTIKSCTDGPDFHECKYINIGPEGEKVKVVRHECCHGFHRPDGFDGKGCVKMSMQSLEETLDDMEAEEFLKLVRTADVGDLLNVNATIFVPSNDAVEDFRRDLVEVNAIAGEESGGGGVIYNVDDGFAYRRKRSASLEDSKFVDIVKGHFAKGFINTHDFRNGEKIKTYGNDLKISVYNTHSEKIVMANCARVVSKDHYATNGVAHVVDKVIIPTAQTIAGFVGQDVQLRTLSKILKSTGLEAQLANPDGQFTLFAPTDEAFNKVDVVLREKMLNGNSCGKHIISHHVLNNIICSGAVDVKAKTVNSLNKYLVLEKDEEDMFVVEDVLVVVKDVMTTNGVVHIIEDVLVPERAKSISKALDETGRTTFNELVEAAGLKSSMEDVSNATIFAPSKAVLDKLDPSDVEKLKEDPDELAKLLTYHVAKPERCRCDFANNALLETGVEGKHIRINVYPRTGIVFPFPGSSRALYTAQCARIVEENEVCGATIHTVDKLLALPSDSVMDVLKDAERYSKFYELIKFAELEEEMERNAENPVTVFAPDNDAFETPTKELVDVLFEDKEAARETVMRHVAEGMICCAGIQRTNPFVDSSHVRSVDQESFISVRKSNRGRLRVENAGVTECDKTAENGVVHTVDDIIFPRSILARRAPNFDAMSRFFQLFDSTIYK